LIFISITTYFQQSNNKLCGQFALLVGLLPNAQKCLGYFAIFVGKANKNQHEKIDTEITVLAPAQDGRQREEPHQARG
jgi:hypothetical protein